MTATYEPDTPLTPAERVRVEAFGLHVPPVADSVREELARVLKDHDAETENGEFLSEVDYHCCADAILASPVLARIQAEAVDRAVKILSDEGWFSPGVDRLAVELRGDS